MYLIYLIICTTSFFNQIFNLFLIVISRLNWYGWLCLRNTSVIDSVGQHFANEGSAAGKESLTSDLRRSWMDRLSVSLAADAVRCLHGRQILLDTYKHKDVCWVVRCSVCTTCIISSSENPSFFLGCVVSPSTLSSTGKSGVYLQTVLEHNHSLFIRAQIVTVFEGNSFAELVAIFAQEEIYRDPCANMRKNV